MTLDETVEHVEAGESVSFRGIDYIFAPIDAEGKTIRVGDVVETPIEEPFEVREIAIDESGTWLVRDRMGVAYDARECIHYRKPTVEDVLCEMLDAVDDDRAGQDKIISRYAKMLQLKEDA